jgi:hypothetical protein
MSLPVTVGGRPNPIVGDESGGIGSIRGDIADERAPKIVSHLRLDIQLMDRRAVALADNGDNGPFGRAHATAGARAALAAAAPATRR